MDDRVRQYLQSKLESAPDNDYEKNVLISAGLFDRVYSPDGNSSPEYPCSEQGDDGVTRYCKQVPIYVTPEEFRQIEKRSGFTPSRPDVSTAANIMAIVIMIAGFIAGIVVGVNSGDSYHDEFSFTPAMMVWLSSAFSGIMLFGLSIIINLLNVIACNS